MRRLAKRKDVELWSLDECHFQQHGTRCRMWVPPEEKDPVVLHAPTRKSVACFGAVSLESGKFIRAMSVKFNAETFETFLKKLLRHRSRRKKMVIVLDNARYHHAKLLAPLLHRYRRHLTLLFLPPYSPQLAPIERVWKLARRLATHNRYFANLDQLLMAVDSCFACWQKPNSVLRRLCGII
ncbi:MAG: IS630 family transposase [Woeseiaceae bacterium]